MPELPAVPQVIRFDLNWKVDADTTAITRHFVIYTGGPPNEGNLTSLASDFTDSSSAFQALAPTSVGVLGCEATDLSADDAAQVTAGTPWVGTASGGRLAPATCVLASHQIGRRYRGGKPRTYLPIGVTTDIGTNGEWLSGSVDSFQAAWAAFASSIPDVAGGTTTLGLVNVSYYKGFTNVPYGSPTKYRRVPTPRDTPLVNPFASTVIRAKIASQRRRNRDS